MGTNRMSFLRIFALTFFTLVFSLPVIVYGQASINPGFSLHAPVPRSGGIPPRSFKGGLISGGVLTVSEAEFRYGADKKFVSSEQISLGSYDPEKGFFCVNYNSECFKYQVSQDRIGILASLVHNDAVGLFSAFGEEIIKTKEGPDREGYVLCEDIQYNLESYFCAKELAGSDLEESLLSLDFASRLPEFLVEEHREDEWIFEYNSSLPSESFFKDFEDAAWEVSDLNSRIIVSLNNGEARISGSPHLFERVAIRLDKKKVFENKLSSDLYVSHRSDNGDIDFFAAYVGIIGITKISENPRIKTKNELVNLPDRFLIDKADKLTEELSKLVRKIDFDDNRELKNPDDFSQRLLLGRAASLAEDIERLTELKENNPASYKTENAKYISTWYETYKDEYDSDQYKAKQENVLDGILVLNELALLRSIKKNNNSSWLHFIGKGSD